MDKPDIDKMRGYLIKQGFETKKLNNLSNFDLTDLYYKHKINILSEKE